MVCSKTGDPPTIRTHIAYAGYDWSKMMMRQKRFLIPYQLELANELNIERFQLTKAGQIQFNHPDGTHDDRTWGIALAMFATRTRPVPQFKPVTRFF